MSIILEKYLQDYKEYNDTSINTYPSAINKLNSLNSDHVYYDFLTYESHKNFDLSTIPTNLFNKNALGTYLQLEIPLYYDLITNFFCNTDKVRINILIINKEDNKETNREHHKEIDLYTELKLLLCCCEESKIFIRFYILDNSVKKFNFKFTNYIFHDVLKNNIKNSIITTDNFTYNNKKLSIN